MALAREQEGVARAGLAQRRVDCSQSVHDPDCVYNISGHSPISGQCDFATLLRDILPQVFGRLDIAKFQFAKKQKIVCQDEHRVVGMMEADGPGTNGKRYDQRYMHMFEFRGDKISHILVVENLGALSQACDAPHASPPAAAS